MREVAQIAAARVGAPVAVIIPPLGHQLVEPAGGKGADALPVLRAWVDEMLAGGEPKTPSIVSRDVPVSSGEEPLGAIALLNGGGDLPDDEARGVLHLAAMAAVTELALVESRQQLEDELRGSSRLVPGGAARGRRARRGRGRPARAAHALRHLARRRDPRRRPAARAHPPADGGDQVRLPGRVRPAPRRPGLRRRPGVRPRRRARPRHGCRRDPGAPPAPARAGRPVVLLRQPGRAGPGRSRRPT